jgi:transcriptional regulator with XRE-family HTH domain
MCGVSFTLAAAQVVRRVRRHLELTQVQLGARSGLSQNHISELERGDREPLVSTLVALVELGLQLDMPAFVALCERQRRGLPLDLSSLPEPTRGTPPTERRVSLRGEKA